MSWEIIAPPRAASGVASWEIVDVTDYGGVRGIVLRRAEGAPLFWVLVDSVRRVDGYRVHLRGFDAGGFPTLDEAAFIGAGFILNRLTGAA